MTRPPRQPLAYPNPLLCLYLRPPTSRATVDKCFPPGVARKTRAKRLKTRNLHRRPFALPRGSALIEASAASWRPPGSRSVALPRGSALIEGPAWPPTQVRSWAFALAGRRFVSFAAFRADLADSADGAAPRLRMRPTATPLQQVRALRSFMQKPPPSASGGASRPPRPTAES